MLKRTLFTILICGLAAAGAFAQSSHYVQTDAVKIAGVTTGTNFNTLTVTQKQTSRTYLDGFGRPVQSVAVKGSPLHKDMVQPVVYDTLGRNTFGYLPYTSTDTTGAYHSNALSQQYSFYTAPYPGNRIARDSLPWNQRLMENSPLQRLLQAGSVGSGFQPGQHYKSLYYGSNVTADSVRLFLPDGSSSAIYAAGKLTYTKATDEQGLTVSTFTDDMGQTILKRQLGPSSGRVDTYYIYNNNGSVAYVVPPMAVALMKASGTYNITLTGVDRLLFKYMYDGQSRLTAKTVPAAGSMYVVYDTLQRPVLLQDANLRSHQQWNYIKYDSKGRAISQGIYTDVTHTSLSSMQAYVNSIDYNTYYAELRSTGSTYGYYTNNVFPTSNIEPLAYSYYDDYHISNTNTADYSYSNQSLSGEGTADTLVNGLLTAVKKRTVGTGITATWLTSVVFYDSRGRTIQTQGNNQLYATLADKATVVMDFTGKPTITKVVKSSSGSSSITVQTAYTYDSSDRITAIDQSYNGGTAKRLADYRYNELGQLIKKNLGRLNSGASYPYDVTLNGTIGSTTNTVAQNSITLGNGFHATAGSTLSYTARIATDYLQALDYRYNIRGQLLTMNNSTLTRDTTNNEDSNDVFGMQVLYNQTDSGLGNTALYNGNMSAMKWMGRTAGGMKTNEKSYVYSYDALDRLTGALYKEKGSSSWNVNVGAFDEKGITYDQSGNIKTLKRNSLISGAVTGIDSLIYSYTGNQLASVTDGTGANYTQNGYKNLSAYSGSTPYAYDDNGNLTTDLKKGITNHFNILNRVDSTRVTAGTNQWITYTYDATGTLLRKVQYKTSATTPVKTTDYIDGFVYENGTLVYFATNEGRVRNSGGTLTNEYVITDQQGNSRVSFEDDGNGRAMVRQENSYYPFGLIMSNGITPATQPNKNLYNGGSEWQNDYVDLPDYYQTFFRNYDQTLGRWIGVDPKPESAESMTPYQYAGNNPGMLNDPMGDLYDLQREAFMQEEAERHAIAAARSRYDWREASMEGSDNAWDQASYAAFSGSGGMDPGVAAQIAMGNGYAVGANNVSAWLGQLFGNGEVSYNRAADGRQYFIFQRSEHSVVDGMLSVNIINDRYYVGDPPKKNANQGGGSQAAFVGGAVLSGGWAADGVDPEPVTKVIGAAVMIGVSAKILYDNRTYLANSAVSLYNKMTAEIDRIATKAAGPQGFQYELLAARSGLYPNVRGGTTFLNAGDVWKYGETTSNNRYSQGYLNSMGLIMNPQFYGNQMEIKIQEKVMIYGYFMQNGSLPAGNSIFR